MIFRKLKTFSIIVLAVMFCVGCRSSRNLNYFNDVRDSSHATIVKQYEPKIQPGDRLSITVSALDPQTAVPYNQNSLSTTGNATVPPPGYMVDKEGNILFPQFGFIPAAGLTKMELRDTLINRLKTVLYNPVVTVEYMNFRVTVLGEVIRQGVISIPDGRMNLLEVIGQAGDITMYGRRDNILVVREKNGKREFGHVNLLSNEVFKSPYFTMQQNDVVYVEMTNKKVTDTDQWVSRNISLITGVVSVLSTLGLLIFTISR